MGEPSSEDGAWASRTEALSTPSVTRLDADLAVGVVVDGKYRIMGKLGRGGMGVVYEAFHAKLRRVVALKIPFPSKLSTTTSARLFREARVAAAIDPSRTARVFDVGTLDDGTPFLVLEKLDGENVAQRLEQLGRMSVVEASDLIAEACLGLAEVHRNGIVHRDIKPSNLFLAKNQDGTTTLRILDFGIASVARPEASDTAADATLTATGAVLGSAPYMAPEQLREASDVDARTDVWALGVTLHELLTGKLPFPGSGAALVAAIAADAPRTPRDQGVSVPLEVEQLLGRCFAKTPAKRPADATDLAHELAPFVSPSMRALLEEKLGRSTLPPPRRRRTVVVAVAAGVLALVSLGTAWRAQSSTAAPHETPVAPQATAEAMVAPAAPTAPTASAREPAPPPASVPAEASTARVSTASESPVAPTSRPGAAPPAPVPARVPKTSTRAEAPPPRPAAAPPAPPVQGASDLLGEREF